MNWDWDKLQEKRQRQRPSSSPDDESGGGDFFNKLPKNFGRFSFFQQGFPLLLVLVIVLGVWLASGFFTVKAGSKGVVTRFGKVEQVVEAGPHYHFPYPIESVIKINTEQLRSIEVGVSSERLDSASSVQLAQTSMFTSDVNIVYVYFTVHYNIQDPAKYLFAVRNQDVVLRNASEAAMREVIANHTIKLVLTQGKTIVQNDAKKALEKIVADYDMGVTIHSVQLGDAYPPKEVRDAFIDADNAQEAIQTAKTVALEERARLVTVANGTAQQMINDAHSYSTTVTKRAEGDAERLRVILAELSRTADVTQKRLYLEAMQEILSSQGVEKVILSKEAGGAVVPLLMKMDGGEPTSKEDQNSRGMAKPASIGSSGDVSITNNKNPVSGTRSLGALR